MGAPLRANWFGTSARGFATRGQQRVLLRVNGIANWGRHQPDNYQDSEDCVEYWTSKAWKPDAQLRKQWNDVNCLYERTAICEAV